MLGIIFITSSTFQTAKNIENYIFSDFLFIKYANAENDDDDGGNKDSDNNGTDDNDDNNDDVNGNYGERWLGKRI